MFYIKDMQLNYNRAAVPQEKFHSLLENEAII